MCQPHRHSIVAHCPFGVGSSISFRHACMLACGSFSVIVWLRSHAASSLMQLSRHFLNQIATIKCSLSLSRFLLGIMVTITCSTVCDHLACSCVVSIKAYGQFRRPQKAKNKDLNYSFREVVDNHQFLTIQRYQARQLPTPSKILSSISEVPCSSCNSLSVN